MQISIFDEIKGECNRCICTTCKDELGTNPIECPFSDCLWCINEKGTYTKRCGVFIGKGGTYGKQRRDLD